jgi:hypothetical protein
MKPEGSLSCKQETATGPYHEGMKRPIRNALTLHTANKTVRRFYWTRIGRDQDTPWGYSLCSHTNGLNHSILTAKTFKNYFINFVSDKCEPEFMMCNKCKVIFFHCYASEDEPRGPKHAKPYIWFTAFYQICYTGRLITSIITNATWNCTSVELEAMKRVPSDWVYNRVTLFLGDISTGTWPSRFGGRLESDTVKCGHESRGTRTWEWLCWPGPAAIVNDRPVLSSERVLHKVYNSRCSVGKWNYWPWV